MVRAGEMVIGAGGTPMKLLRIAADGVAECIVIDHDGRLYRRFSYARSLRPVREMMQPRTCWAETRQVDLIAIEKEERAAAEARRLQRKAARKAKRSNKAFRRQLVMT